jgi:tetratricopeptide (TPR) repeat protein
MSHVRSKQTSQHVEAARAAEARGDFVEAARLYTLALSHSSDATLKAAKESADARAKEQLLEQSTTRARDAEGKQDFTQAAAAWARVFDLAPTAESAHRAAAAFRRAGADPRRGARYGEEAVKLDPNKSAYRVTLALIYADAGLNLRARGEIERAQALEPNSVLVKEALARLKGK